MRRLWEERFVLPSIKPPDVVEESAESGKFFKRVPCRGVDGNVLAYRLDPFPFPMCKLDPLGLQSVTEQNMIDIQKQMDINTKREMEAQFARSKRAACSKEEDVPLKEPPKTCPGRVRFLLGKLFYHHRGQLKFPPPSDDYYRQLKKFVEEISKNKIEKETWRVIKEIWHDLYTYHSGIVDKRVKPSMDQSVSFTKELRKTMLELYPDWKESNSTAC